MSKFDYISKLNVTEESTAEYRFDNIYVNGKTPVLTVKHANPTTNRAYKNGLIRRMSRADKIAASRNRQTTESLNNARRLDRELYPETVVVDWRDVCDGEGNEVPYSKENVYDFLGALPDWIFDSFRDFCAMSEVFTVDGSVIITEDVDEAAKKPPKSSSGS